MSEEQEKISEVIMETAPAVTPFGKIVNYVKIGFATKKAVMAGWALFFGVTAGGGAMVGSGMTADEISARGVIESEIVVLNEKVIQLETLVTSLDHAHTDQAESHEVGYHEHEAEVRPLTVVAPVLIPHDHEQYALKDHKHDPVSVAYDHKHDMEHDHDTTHSHPAKDDKLEIPDHIKEYHRNQTRSIQ